MSREKPSNDELERRCRVDESAAAGPGGDRIDYRAMAESSPDTILIVDLIAEKIDYINRESLLGYAPEELGDANALRAKVHPADLPAAEAHWRDASSGRVKAEVECRFRRKDGGWEWLLSRSRVASRDAEGKPTRLMLTISIVSDRKNLEDLTLACENRYRSVVGAMAEGLVLHAESGEIVSCNASAERILGLTADRITGRTSMDPLWRAVRADGSPFPGEEHPAMITLRTGAPCHGVIMGVHKPDGGLSWISINSQPVQIGGSERPWAVATFSDITERKRLETEYGANAERFKVALAAGPVAVFNQDRDLRYTWIGNPKLGLMEEDTLGRTDEELLGAEYARPLTAIKRRVLETGRGAREEVHLERAGQAGWFDLTVEPLRDASGRIAGVVCAAIDITERKLLERQRQEALARLAAVQEEERGRIARELHDQIAQRLVALAVELKALETHRAGGAPLDGLLRSLRGEVDELQDRVRKIAWDMRAGEVVKSDLESALREYLEDWSERSDTQIDYEFLYRDDRRPPPLVVATLYRVAQEALANVEKHARAHRVSLLLECEEGQTRLIIEDDGRGFEMDALAKVPPSPHRLGLLGMRERVMLAGGTLVIESSPGSGTTVLARFPAMTEEGPK